MKSFFSDIKTYMKFTQNVFQKQLAYRAGVIMFILGEFLTLSITMFLWNAIYKSSEETVINGFTFEEMIIYLLMMFLTAGLTSVNVLYTISSEVKDGSIAINLVRPINFEKRMFFEALGTPLYNLLVIFTIGFTIVNIFYYKISGGIDIANIGLYFLSTTLGLIITFYFYYIFGLLSFKIINMWGTSQMVEAVVMLLSGFLIPITFFPQWALKIIELLPFSSQIYTPVMIYLGKLDSNEIVKAIIIQVVWIGILMIIAKVTWKKLIKSLTILGG